MPKAERAINVIKFSFNGLDKDNSDGDDDDKDGDDDDKDSDGDDKDSDGDNSNDSMTCTSTSVLTVSTPLSLLSTTLSTFAGDVLPLKPASDLLPDANPDTPHGIISPVVLTEAQQLKLKQECRWNIKELHCLLLQAIKDSLFADPFLEAAAALKIPEDQRITIDNSGCLVFLLQSNLFSDWLDWHQVNIGTKFTPHIDPNTVSSGMVNQVFDCSCRGLHKTYGWKTLVAQKENITQEQLD